MPIIVPERGGDDHLFGRLESAGVPLIDEAVAQTQDIRPARIGLMNLMPREAMEATEVQWLRWIGRQSVLQVVPVLIKFDDDKREAQGASREDILKRYMPLSRVRDEGLDGLIVTGDNLEIRKHAYGPSSNPHEMLPDQDVTYHSQLTELFDWADQNVHSTIYSCLAAYFVLRHRFGLVRDVRTQEEGKIFGVYDHDIVALSSELVQGMNDVIRAPHSRWSNLPVEKILGEGALNLVASSEEAGWLFVEASNAAGGKDVFVQAHPEYDRLDLHREYERDRAEGLAIPANYYDGDDPVEENVVYLCTADGRVFHENWIGNMVYPGYSQSA